MAIARPDCAQEYVPMSGQSSVDFDVVIIGSGPAGVSAAFPLLEIGLRVLMVDGGSAADLSPPAGYFLDIREKDRGQWRWMLGPDFSALRPGGSVSPKLRVPTHKRVFEGFQEANHIDADGFVAVGSLSPGGLSNAWGCGVACFSHEELAAFPVTPDEMQNSCGVIARRIGVSGAEADDLTDFFGVDDWSQPPVPLDDLQHGILARYKNCRAKMKLNGFELGRARVAALAKPLADRDACNRCGNCLWGCERRSLYSATEDLKQLSGIEGFNYRTGFVVDRVDSAVEFVTIRGKDENRRDFSVRAKRVLLAAGTLASTRLALQSIDYRKPVSMQSCPTAAFMLSLPRHIGRAHNVAFGLGQLAFSLKLIDGTQGFGSLFNTTGIPVSEFARHIPFGKRFAVDLLEPLLKFCVVGNFFLPGDMTDARLQLDKDDGLTVKGSFRDGMDILMKQAQNRLSASFKKLGAWMVPLSFKVAEPGADIHYAASLPMCREPVRGQTDRYGALVGAHGVHIVDGASLSSLPAKSHTLVIMANADRIARHIAKTWKK